MASRQWRTISKCANTHNSVDTTAVRFFRIAAYSFYDFVLFRRESNNVWIYKMKLLMNAISLFLVTGNSENGRYIKSRHAVYCKT